MDYFDKYSERLRVQGTTAADNAEQRMIADMRKFWENNPSFRRVCVIEPNGTQKYLRIQTAKKTVGVDKIYIHPDDRIVSGTIILNLQEYSWLVLDVRYTGHIFQQANIVRINRILKYMDDGIVKTVYTRVKGFSRVDGIDEYYYFTLPENTINIFIPTNNETKKLKRDKRLMIDGLPYRISRIDNFTHDGVTILFAVEDIRNPNDTDEIADYQESVIPITTEIQIQGPTEIPFGLDGIYKLVNEEQQILSPEWFLLDEVAWATLTIQDNKAHIKIKQDTGLIGKTIILKASWNGEDLLFPILIKSLV
jgi:hypothetical protein